MVLIQFSVLRISDSKMRAGMRYQISDFSKGVVSRVSGFRVQDFPAHTNQLSSPEVYASELEC